MMSRLGLGRFGPRSSSAPYRRSMTEGGQRNLVQLAFEKSKTKKMDLDEFVLRFARKHSQLSLL